MTISRAKAKPVGPRKRVAKRKAALNDNSAEVRYDQYYTRADVAEQCLADLADRYDLDGFQMVEPTAGAGAFLQIMPSGSWGYDIDPKLAGIVTADILTVRLHSDRPICILGNPPFGRNASMAKRIFNHLAPQCAVIGLILPRSFRKASIQNALDRDFHLFHDQVVPKDAFLFRGKAYDVPATFQIWQRRPTKRALRSTETRHPDFEFTTFDLADFALQRVGAQAGRVHHDMTLSEKAHYFIKGDVEEVMVALRGEFARVASDVAGKPSLAMTEVVSLYRRLIAHRAGVAIHPSA